MTQQSHYWAYILRKPQFKKTQVSPSVHCSTMYNSQDMAATYMSIHRWRDKEVVVHIYGGKVKVVQSCPTLYDTIPYSPWNSPGQNTGVDSLSVLQGIIPTQGWNPGLPHCRWILYQLNHKGSPRILEWVAYPFSRGSSQPRNWTGVSCIAGGFFTNWAIREAMVEYYSAFKRNEFESVELMWMKLESAIQSEVSQRKIDIVYECIYIYIYI